MSTRPLSVADSIQAHQDGQLVRVPLSAIRAAMQDPYPTNCNARGIAAGQYYPYPVGCTVVASRTNATFNWTGSTASTPFDVIAIPANTIGPSGYLEFEIKWSFTPSANAKTLGVVLGHTNFAWTDVQTTNNSSTMKFTVQNQGSTQAQLGASNVTGAGGSTIDFDFLAFDFTQEQRFTLWGTLASASDVMKIQSFTVKAYNPPIYSNSRLQYGKPMFYGANAHYDDTQSIAMHIAGLKTMGMKLMRMTWEGPVSMPNIIAYATALKADNTGIQMLLCLDIEIQSGGINFVSEQAAYATTYANVLPVVQALAPLGVTLYECGNEADTKRSINIGDAQGGLPSDFSNTLVPLFRGVQRGAIDAVHAVPGCLAGSNAYTVCSIALADMMWYGTQPDGSSGWPLVRWDWTSWHNYEDYGPLTAVEMGVNRPWVNIYEYLNRRYGGVPIIISEWNGKSSDTDPQRAAWASRHMFEAYQNRYRWNIAAIIVYAMYGSPWNVLDGTTNAVISTFGTTVQSFISSNPDTGT
jgi:hypothetical protein